MKHALPARGATSLVVVLVLFFVMLMAAVFNGRSLVFEQRTSANQYRYTQAFEAGEAGLQWAATLLNGGRVDAACLPTNDPTHSTFRERYLTTDYTTGVLLPVANVTAGCVKTDAGWSCSCPTAGAPVLVQPAGDAAHATFTVQFVAVPQSGMVRILARACSNFGSQCTAAAAQRSDAYAEVESLLALAGGLRTPPSAALTVHDDVNVLGPDLRFTNTDEETRGITVNAGGAINGTPRLTSAPGSVASRSMVSGDSTLSTLYPTDKMFVNFFGSDLPAFQRLGSVRRVTCTGGCALAVQAAYNEGYRMVWVDGDLSLGSGMFGTPTDPLLLAASGNVQLGSAQVNGVVYSGADTWNNGSSDGQVRGAAIAQGTFTGGGTAHFVYDADILARLHFRTGTFARVAGSWSDKQ